MKKPQQPPNQSDTIETLFQSSRFSEVYQWGRENNIAMTYNGHYYHWDKLRFLEPPDGVSLEELWFLLKTARRNNSFLLPFYSIEGSRMHYNLTSQILKQLHNIDAQTKGSLGVDGPMIGQRTVDRFVISTLEEEAISSSQLEGADTTRKVAKEMIRTGRQPRNRSERMIYNNYLAMLHLRDIEDQPLTPQLIRELHTIVTQGTMSEEDIPGQYRVEEDQIIIADRISQATLFVPPPAVMIPSLLKELCDFANTNDDGDQWVHPVVRSVIIHFMMGYIHPFPDGNGRTARLLFYWSMARHGYWICQYTSISSVIKGSSSSYSRSYLYAETDQFDLTYFIESQLSFLQRSVTSLMEYIERKRAELQKTTKMLRLSMQSRMLNTRQLSLLSNAIKHPGKTFTIQTHQNSHGITYRVARTDLEKLCELKLLIKHKYGNMNYFIAPEDIRSVVSNIHSDA